MFNDKPKKQVFRNDIFACLLKCESCKFHIDYAYVKKHNWKNLNYCCLLLEFNEFLKTTKLMTDENFLELMLNNDYFPKCWKQKGKEFKL